MSWETNLTQVHVEEETTRAPHVIMIVGCVMSEEVGTLFNEFPYSVDEYHVLSIKVGMLPFVRYSLVIFYQKLTTWFLVMKARKQWMPIMAPSSLTSSQLRAWGICRAKWVSMLLQMQWRKGDKWMNIINWNWWTHKKKLASNLWKCAVQFKHCTHVVAD